MAPLLLAGASLLAAEPPGLGMTVSEADAAAVDFVVMPDGRGLPAGSGSAPEGLVVYQRECRVCHGDGGQGGPNDRLTGGAGSLATQAPVKTIGSYWPYATTVFDYVRRAMPYHLPGSLSADEVYAVTAYLLAENGIIEPDQMVDARSLPAIQMPNREGFSWAWPAD
jgi:cytochrome c